MRKALILVLVVATALVAACERGEDKPVVRPGAAPALNLDKEISFLRTVVKEDPNNLQAWISLGNHLMDTQQFTGAIDAYGKALELDPNNLDVKVDRGVCYRRSGRPDIAVEHFREAIKINPKHPFAHRNLGVVLAFDLNDPKGGREAFEKYLELSPAAPDKGQIEQLIADLKEQEEAQKAARP